MTPIRFEYTFQQYFKELLTQIRYSSYLPFFPNKMMYPWNKCKSESVFLYVGENRDLVFSFHSFRKFFTTSWLTLNISIAILRLHGVDKKGHWNSSFSGVKILFVFLCLIVNTCTWVTKFVCRKWATRDFGNLVKIRVY